MTTFGYILIIAAVSCAAGIIFWYRHRTKKTMDSLNRMLDDAMQGEFAEEHFDESMLSAIETKMAHYLAASATSARNVQSEKDKIKTLIADISHQTKTPIANILLYTQLLNEQPLPEDSRPCVEALEHQTKKLQALIDALLKTSRLESGVIALRPVVWDLSPVIHSAVAQLMPKADAKGITIDIGDTDVKAVCDPKWTEEAIYNLLDNAVKYAPSPGQVHIHVTAYEFFTAIHVRDTGPGISEEDQPKIFQRFYRSMEHRTEEGVGIGLYLVRQIAEGQGGYVKIASERDNGSTFSLYLPRK